MDDRLIAAKNNTHIQKLKAKLKKKFDMKDLRKAKKILGMEINRDRSTGRLRLSQENYILKMLERFNMTEAILITILLAAHFRLSSSQCPNSQEEEDEMSRVPYANAVGSLMYTIVCTRPNLAYSVSTVSRFISNLRRQHWEPIKWVLRLSLIHI